MFFSLTKEKSKLQIELIERKEVESGMTGNHSNSAVENVLKGSQYERAIPLKSKGMPFIKKETNPSRVIEMVCASIIAVLAVVMSKTRPVTHLKVVYKALFKFFCLVVMKQSLFSMTFREEVYVP
jgi:hypothetical protein